MGSLRCFISALIFFLFCCFSLKAYASVAVDTISLGQSLSGNQTIVSQGGNFQLGFFTPGNSHNYYIGIWFKKVSKQTVVWVANRDKPLSNTSSELKISEDGNLILLNQSNIQVWSTNLTSSGSNSSVAALLDSGNLVLRDGFNSSTLIWQSFDHPTDTWMPGARLGLNKITGEVTAITSWKSLEDPSLGMFSLAIDPNGTSQYFLRWNRSTVYWTSGRWTGQRFSSVAESDYLNRKKTLVADNPSTFISIYVSNEKENYYMYNISDNSVLIRITVDVIGQIKAFIWSDSTHLWVLPWSRPSDRCDAYSLCGAFGICNQDNIAICDCLQGFEPRYMKDWNLSDWSGGCRRKTELQCQNDSYATAKKDAFLKIPNMRYPTNPWLLAVGSAEECEVACLDHCSCTAYAYASGCTIWNGDLINLQQLSNGNSTEGGDLNIRLAASELPSSRVKRKKFTWAISSAVSGLLAILGAVLVLIWRYRRRTVIQPSKSDLDFLVPFKYGDLQRATKDFSEKLGGGGFGSVFKGSLADSTAIAVKKLEGCRQGEKEFRAEVSTIGMIHHVNLVRLLGFCSEDTKKLLVYDYMPQGSLASHLFGKNSEILDWKTRYHIAIGTARGLAYLHEKCRDCIIHCDIKPENILLDDAFAPKVADFGLAKLVGREFSRVLTTLRGTRGYLAPEWIAGVAITSKADVYSYGMMLFEIISGRRNTEPSDDGNSDYYFPISAAREIVEGDVSSLLDYKLGGNANMEELSKACRVACWCIQDEEKHRPSMGQVVQFLEGTLELKIPPIPRFLLMISGT